MTYTTDGSFEGLLTAVFEAFSLKEDPEEIMPDSCCQVSLFGGNREIITDFSKADRVYAAISGKISPIALEELYAAWLSEDFDIGALVLHCVRRGFVVGPHIMEQIQDSKVFRVHDLYRKVMKEVHFFIGTLRFTRLSCGIYYAAYEPDNNITGIISPHFEERLNDQPWIIHDCKRNICALYDLKGLVFSNQAPMIPDEMKDCDADFDMLWQKYFKSIAIESRVNPKLQRNYLPKRYWKHLTEMQNR
jgi:probable DNA metabolism protein